MPIRKQVFKMKALYAMLLIPAVHLAVFHYAPLYGILIAFKDYKPGLGIWSSPWNQFEHFGLMLSDNTFLRALRNTFYISFLKLAAGFALPIGFALLINEVAHKPFKRVVQTISSFPHFISWVIIASMAVEVFSLQGGVINTIIKQVGGEPIAFLSSRVYFVPLLIITDAWKEVGWASILYLASISSIAPELYEAASIDGANRFQKMKYVTLPALVPMIVILFLLRLGSILNGGFDQIFNLYNPLVYEVADILDTYVYRVGLVEYRFDYSAAVGLFKNVVGLAFLIIVNQIVRRRNEYGVW